MVDTEATLPLKLENLELWSLELESIQIYLHHPGKEFAKSTTTRWKPWRKLWGQRRKDVFLDITPWSCQTSCRGVAVDDSNPTIRHAAKTQGSCVNKTQFCLFALSVDWWLGRITLRSDNLFLQTPWVTSMVSVLGCLRLGCLSSGSSIQTVQGFYLPLVTHPVQTTVPSQMHFPLEQQGLLSMEVEVMLEKLRQY